MDWHIFDIDDSRSGTHRHHHHTVVGAAGGRGGGVWEERRNHCAFALLQQTTPADSSSSSGSGGRWRSAAAAAAAISTSSRREGAGGDDGIGSSTPSGDASSGGSGGGGGASLGPQRRRGRRRRMASSSSTAFMESDLDEWLRSSAIHDSAARSRGGGGDDTPAAAVGDSGAADSYSRWMDMGADTEGEGRKSSSAQGSAMSQWRGRTAMYCFGGYQNSHRTWFNDLVALHALQGIDGGLEWHSKPLLASHHLSDVVPSTRENATISVVYPRRWYMSARALSSSASNTGSVAGGAVASIVSASFLAEDPAIIEDGTVETLDPLFDQKRLRAVLFGGQDRSKVLGDLWMLDMSSQPWVWREVKFSDGERRPPPRAHHSAVVHRDSLYVFGGMDEQHRPLNDLWRLDLTCWVWQEMRPAGIVPPARYGHTAHAINFYSFSGGKAAERPDVTEGDGDDWRMVVMFGSGSGESSIQTYHNDVWTYRFKDGTWHSHAGTMMRNSPGNVPHGRAMHCSEYIGRGCVVVFGGFRSPQHKKDAWIIDLYSEKFCPIPRSERKERWPRSRRGAVMIFDRQTRCLVMQGGGSAKRGCLSDICILETRHLFKLYGCGAPLHHGDGIRGAAMERLMQEKSFMDTIRKSPPSDESGRALNNTDTSRIIKLIAVESTKIEKNPSDIDALMRRAEAFFDIELHDRALEDTTMALHIIDKGLGQIDVSSSTGITERLMYTKANALYALNRMEECAKQCDRLIQQWNEKQPSQTQLQLQYSLARLNVIKQRAKAYLFMRRYDDALRDCDQILREASSIAAPVLSPDSNSDEDDEDTMAMMTVSAMKIKATCLTHRKQFDHAIQWITSAKKMVLDLGNKALERKNRGRSRRFSVIIKPHRLLASALSGGGGGSVSSTDQSLMERRVKKLEEFARYVVGLKLAHEECEKLLKMSIDLMARDVDKAIGHLETALKMDDSNVDILLRLARLRMNKQEYKAAMRYGKRAMELDPANWQPYAIVGEYMLMKRNVAEALALLEKALEKSSSSTGMKTKDADTASIQKLIRDARSKQKNMEEAVKRYNEAQELHMNHIYQRALTEIDRALELDPKLPRYLLLKVSILNSLEQHEDAHQIAKQVTDIAPRRYFGYLAQGETLILMHMFREASKVLQMGLRQDTRNAQLRKQYERAEELLKKKRLAHVNFLIARDRLADISSSMGLSLRVHLDAQELPQKLQAEFDQILRLLDDSVELSYGADVEPLLLRAKARLHCHHFLPAVTDCKRLLDRVPLSQKSSSWKDTENAIIEAITIGALAYASNHSMEHALPFLDHYTNRLQQYWLKKREHKEILSGLRSQISRLMADKTMFDEMIAKGRQHAHDGDYTMASHIFHSVSKAIKASKTGFQNSTRMIIEVNFEAAEAEFYLGRFQESLDLCQSAVDADHKNFFFPHVQVLRTMNLLRLGRMDEALFVCSNALTSYPFNAPLNEVWKHTRMCIGNRVANMSLHQGQHSLAIHDYEQAVKDFTCALQQSPILHEAYMLRARALLSIGRPAASLRDLDTFLKMLGPIASASINDERQRKLHIEALYFKGQAMMRLKRVNDAKQLFRTGLDLCPDHARLISRLEEIHELEKQQAKSDQFAIQAQSILNRYNENYGDNDLIRGHLLSEQEQQEALQLFEKAILAFPGNAGLFIRRGTLLLQMNKFQDALQDATTATIIDPTNYSALALKTKIYIQIGKFRDAKEALQVAIESAEDDEDDVHDARQLAAVLNQRISHAKKATNLHDEAMGMLQELRDMVQQEDDQQMTATHSTSIAMNIAHARKNKELREFKMQIVDKLQHASNLDPFNQLLLIRLVETLLFLSSLERGNITRQLALLKQAMYHCGVLLTLHPNLPMGFYLQASISRRMYVHDNFEALVALVASMESMCEDALPTPSSGKEAYTVLDSKMVYALLHEIFSEILSVEVELHTLPQSSRQKDMSFSEPEDMPIDMDIAGDGQSDLDNIEKMDLSELLGDQLLDTQFADDLLPAPDDSNSNVHQQQQQQQQQHTTQASMLKNAFGIAKGLVSGLGQSMSREMSALKETVLEYVVKMLSATPSACLSVDDRDSLLHWMIESLSFSNIEHRMLRYRGLMDESQTKQNAIELCARVYHQTYGKETFFQEQHRMLFHQRQQETISQLMKSHGLTEGQWRNVKGGNSSANVILDQRMIGSIIMLLGNAEKSKQSFPSKHMTNLLHVLGRINGIGTVYGCSLLVEMCAREIMNMSKSNQWSSLSLYHAYRTTSFLLFRLLEERSLPSPAKLSAYVNKIEMDLLCKSFTTMEDCIRNVFDNHWRLSQSNMRIPLRICMKLLCVVQICRIMIGMPTSTQLARNGDGGSSVIRRPSTVRQQLVHIIEAACVNMNSTLRSRILSKLKLPSQQQHLPPRGLIILCHWIRQILEEYEMLFDSVFPRSVSLMTLVARKFHELIKNEFKNTCLHSGADNEGVMGKAVPEKVFELPRCMTEMFAFLSDYCPNLRPFNIGKLILPFVFLYQYEYEDRMKQWCRRAVEVDSLLPMSDKVVHSTSVIDLFAAVAQGIAFLDDTFSFLSELDGASSNSENEMGPDGQSGAMSQLGLVKQTYVDVISRTIHLYARMVYTRFLDIATEAKKVFERDVKYVTHERRAQLTAASRNPFKGFKKRLNARQTNSAAMGKRPHQQHHFDEDVAFQLLQQMCVCMTDICLAMEKLEDISIDMQFQRTTSEPVSMPLQPHERATIRDSFDSLQRVLTNGIQKMIQYLAHQVFGDIIQRLLRAIAQDDVTVGQRDSLLATLLDFLDSLLSRLIPMCGPYSDDLFQPFLQELFDFIVHAFKEMLFPPMSNPIPSFKTVKYLQKQLFSHLRNYFVAGGEGLDGHYVDKELQFLQLMMQYVHEPTSNVVYVFQRYMSEIDSQKSSAEDENDGESKQKVNVRYLFSILYRRSIRDRDTVAGYVVKNHMTTAESNKLKVESQITETQESIKSLANACHDTKQELSEIERDIQKLREVNEFLKSTYKLEKQRKFGRKECNELTKKLVDSEQMLTQLQEQQQQAESLLARELEILRNSLVIERTIAEKDGNLKKLIPSSRKLSLILPCYYAFRNGMLCLVQGTGDGTVPAEIWWVPGGVLSAQSSLYYSSKDHASFQAFRISVFCILDVNTCSSMSTEAVSEMGYDIEPPQQRRKHDSLEIRFVIHRDQRPPMTDRDDQEEEDWIESTRVYRGLAPEELDLHCLLIRKFVQESVSRQPPMKSQKHLQYGISSSAPSRSPLPQMLEQMKRKSAAISIQAVYRDHVRRTSSILKQEVRQDDQQKAKRKKAKLLGVAKSKKKKKKQYQQQQQEGEEEDGINVNARDAVFYTRTLRKRGYPISQELRDKFGLLDEHERLLKKYHCKNELHLPGELFILSSCICFSPDSSSSSSSTTTTTGGFGSDPSLVKVSYVQIDKFMRMRDMTISGGLLMMMALRIVDRAGRSYVFSGLANRDQCFQEMVDAITNGVSRLKVVLKDSNRLALVVPNAR